TIVVVDLLAVMRPDGAFIAGVHIDLAFGAYKRFIHSGISPGEVTAFAVDNRAVRIGKAQGVVVKDFPILLAGTDHSATCTFRRHRVGVFYPVGHVDIVHVLFRDMVAAQPVDIIAVSHLRFHLRLISLTGFYPYTAVIPVHLAADNIANGSVLHALDGFQVVGLVPSLQTGYHVQLFGFGDFCCGQYPADTVGIYRNGLLQKYMFALFYGLFEMIRPEAGRCCQEYHIRQGDGLFICVKTYKFMFFWNIHFFWMSLCDGGIAGVEAISESIGHCHQFNIMSCSQSLEHSTGTTSTTTNNSN